MGIDSCKMPFWHSIVDPLVELLVSGPLPLLPPPPAPPPPPPPPDAQQFAPLQSGTGGVPGSGPGGGGEPGGGAYGQLKSHGSLKCAIGTRHNELGAEYVAASTACSAGV